MVAGEVFVSAGRNYCLVEVWSMSTFMNRPYFRTRFENERGRLGTRSSSNLWKCDKICRERFLVSDEVISGFSRRTRPDEVPSPDIHRPDPLELLRELSHSRAYKAQIMTHTPLISSLAEGRTDTPQTRKMLAPTGPASGRIAVKKGHQERSKI